MAGKASGGAAARPGGPPAGGRPAPRPPRCHPPADRASPPTGRRPRAWGSPGAAFHIASDRRAAAGGGAPSPGGRPPGGAAPPPLALAVATPWRTASVHVRVGAQVLEDLLALLFIQHQIDALPVVAALDAALGPHEQRLILLPVHVP